MSENRYSFASLGAARRVAMLTALTSIGLIVPRAAHAQSDKTAAEALFQDGKRLMGEGKYSEACPKLDESNKIDPGAGTLTALALCHRGEGKTATAWSEFKEVISLARRDGRKDREQVAEENINELEPKLSRLTLVLDRGMTSQGLEIKLDTAKIPLAMIGSPFPADPGIHKLTVSGAGFKSRESVVEIGPEHDDKRVTIAPLEREEAAPPVKPPPGQPTESTPDNTKTVNPTLRTTSYILGGVGIAGLGVGIVTGIIASSKHSDANCNNDICPSNDATDKENSARTVANISTVGFVAGGVLLAGGVVLYLFSSSSPKKTGTAASVSLVPSVSPQGGFGSIVGRF